MEKNIKIFVILFFIYSFAGWLVESIKISISEKKIVNRGFLIGPICPIYGYGVVLISALLKKYQDDIVITFFMSMVICGILEYATSYFMEKIFNARWWDYSCRKFNINGRVCLENLILFGIAGCIITHFINPVIILGINKVPDIFVNIILIVLVITYITDTTMSFKIIINLKTISNEIKDNTAEISEKVKNIIYNKSLIYRRMVNAFPLIKEKVEFKKWEIQEEIKEKIRKIKKEIE